MSVRPRLRSVLKWGGVGALLAVAATGVGVAVIPLVRVERATADSRACLARAKAPRGPGFPECGGMIRDFEKLAAVYYTNHDATYRAEELWARIMTGLYENAAVGDPDPGELARTAAFVGDAQEVVENGSRRLSLEDLGPRVASPDLGVMAAALGDRRTLTAHPANWKLWSVRTRAIEAALAEGRVQDANEMATLYAKDDPREADLRTTIGAVLCMGPKPELGLDVLAGVPADRAEKRHAAMSRNYGAVLGVMVACAKRAKLPPPPIPSGGAGAADLEETRAVLDIRVEDDPKLLAIALDRAESMLSDDAGVSDTSSPYARAYLVAALIARDADAPRDPAAEGRGSRLAPGALDDLVRRRPTEGSFGPEPRDMLAVTLDEGQGLYPVLPSEMLARASDELARIAELPDPKPVPPPAAHADKARSPHTVTIDLKTNATAGDDLAGSADAPAAEDKPHPKPPPPFAERRAHLRKAAGSLALLAGIAATRAGRADVAAKELTRTSELLELDPGTANLLLGVSAYVSGSAASAAAFLDPKYLDGADAKTRLACAIVRALAFAVTGDKLGAARALENAKDLDAKAADARLHLDLRWLDLALTTPHAVEGAPSIPTYTGQADPSHRWETLGGDPIARNLDAWENALASDAPNRLAFRYAVLDVGGDAPEALTAYLVAGGRLLDDGTVGRSTEVWLDAMTSHDAPRVSASAYAFARREAARIRGDEASAAIWAERLRNLRAASSAGETLEIARFLGL